MRPARRLPSETHTMTLGGHEFAVSLAYDPEDDYRLREVVFVGRGKIGQGLDLILHDFGIQFSRLLQRRDPETGDPLPKKTIKLSTSVGVAQDDGGLS